MKVNIPDFTKAHVLIVGDIMLDRYWYSSNIKISSEAPVPIVKVGVIENRPGGSANVAINIATLGAKSQLIGITGIDEAADIINQQLNNVNVKCNLVSLNTYSTIIKLRVISHNQQLIRFDFEKTYQNIDYKSILERIIIALPNTNVLVCSDYAKGTLENIQSIIQQARSANIPVLIDPKGTNFNRYNGATLLTPNLAEFEAVVGSCMNEEMIVIHGMNLITHHNLTALLITRSDKGMTLLQLNQKPLYFPAQAQEVYDVTGAGDTVIGVLAASLASGINLEHACIIANAAAGIVVGKLGTSFVQFLELVNLIHKYNEGST